jgi:alpha-dioxygenase
MEMDQGKSFGCPMQTQSFKFHPTVIDPKTGTSINEQTHWWDSSMVYGQDAASLSKVRLYKDGLLKEGPSRGVLPRKSITETVDSTRTVILNVGDNTNSWAGVQLLQDLFLREHNAVAKALKKAHHAELDDEALFQKARVVVNAVAAKIHTVDWTVELLKTNVLKVGITANWNGIPYDLRAARKGGFPPPPPNGGLLGLAGSKHKTDNHGVPFYLTEEFVAVYRLHSMLPDVLPLTGTRGHLTLEQLLGR